MFSYAQGKSLSETIQEINPKIKKERAEAISVSIKNHAKKHKVDEKIIFSIIAVETHFRNKVRQNSNDTQDHGICQINTVWIEEFKRLKRRPLEIEKLSEDDYCIDRMAEIISIHKNKNDEKYWSKYHSKTPRLRKVYEKKVSKVLNNNVPYPKEEPRSPASQVASNP